MNVRIDVKYNIRKNARQNARENATIEYQNRKSDAMPEKNVRKTNITYTSRWDVWNYDIILSRWGSLEVEYFCCCMSFLLVRCLSHVHSSTIRVCWWFWYVVASVCHCDVGFQMCTANCPHLFVKHVQKHNQCVYFQIKFSKWDELCINLYFKITRLICIRMNIANAFFQF